MKKIKSVVLIILISLITGVAHPSNTPDNDLIKYYSALLTLNLEHAMESSNVIYHLSKRSSFDKDMFEDQLDKIKQHIDYANTNIANIVSNTTDAQKSKIDKYLENIDEHLSNVYLDIENIRKKLNKEESVTSLLADVYYQVSNAERVDHKEIKRILKLKSFEEPVMVVPEIIK